MKQIDPDTIRDHIPIRIHLYTIEDNYVQQHWQERWICKCFHNVALELCTEKKSPQMDYAEANISTSFGQKNDVVES